MKGQSLTVKQQLFVREYAVDFNATAAARRAGYPARSASVTGFGLLRKPNIQSAVLQAVGQAIQKCDLSVQYVIERLMALADSDVSELCEWTSEDDFRIKAKSELTKAQRRTIKSITCQKRTFHNKDGTSETVQTVKLEARDPYPAKRMLGQFLQIWSGGIPEAAATDPNSAYLLPPDQAREVLAKLNGRDPMKLIGAVAPVQEAQEVKAVNGVNGNGKH